MGALGVIVRSMIKRTIHALADNRRFTEWLSRRGMQWGFARRFIAGETLEEAFPAVRELNDKGLNVTLDYLGEAVTDENATREAAEIYRRMLDTIDKSDVRDVQIVATPVVRVVRAPQ